MIHSILQIIIQAIDKVPILKGYRTVILAGVLVVLATLDAVGVTHGLYDQVAPFVYPLAVGTALAHDPKAPA